MSGRTSPRATVTNECAPAASPCGGDTPPRYGPDSRRPRLHLDLAPRRGPAQAQARGLAPPGPYVNSALKLFERVVITALVGLMAALILVLVVELGWTVFRDVVARPLALLESGDLLEVFGSFLVVLIALELLETMKAYLDEHVIHAELVLQVALIAIARKIIVLDVKGLAPATVLAIAALVLALAAAYWLEGRRRRKPAAGPEQRGERPMG